MIVTLIAYCPRSHAKNLGFAYNELMARLHDEDWACFLDHDACFTTYDWYPQLEDITARITEACILTATTNRVGSRWQLAPGVDRNNHSMEYHRAVGAAMQSQARSALRDVTHESLMSGVLILLSKQTWLRLGGFADGFLGVDNSIHQSAREKGCRVYLMEGVYVYHWYRADAVSPGPSMNGGARRELAVRAKKVARVLGKSSETTAAREPRRHPDRFSEAPYHALATSARTDRTSPSRSVVTGQRVLAIGRQAAAGCVGVEARRPASVTVVELDEPGRGGARRRGEANVMDDEGNGAEFPEGSFDVIIAADLWERLRRPERILRKLRAWLAAGGRLITSFETVRTLAVAEGLLTGRWLAGSGEAEAGRPIRFFTRREIEKLLYRTGFDPEFVEVLPGSGHAEWVGRGRPGKIAVGELNFNGLSAGDAEEFYSRGFALEAVPSGLPDFGLTSIIIVTFNQLEFTRQCVDSISRMTDEPYRLIFVDNASSDGTVDYLNSLVGATVLRNEENRGFPAAVNQGIAVATGRQILLLNNDTTVTTGWLRRMLTALHSEPDIGLVGPCSNFVGSEQRIEVEYGTLTELDAFAWEWGKTHVRQQEDTHRLIGFCLLIRREVVDAIGLLDERFGIGCFEDDDYCLRAIGAGWRAVIARDAFVHHFGARSFAGGGFDLGAIMRENEQRFREKWGPSRQPGAQLQLDSPAPSNRPKTFALDLAPGGGLLLRQDRVRISLCMIARDSAATLRPCLESIRPWVDEMVIVDTGSSDDTPRIVEELGGRLFHFPWCDDFAAARNESLRHARGDWLFWMDSDDTIPAECGRQLRALVDREVEPGLLGYVVQVHCPGAGDDGDPANDVTVVDHVKLIRNRPDLRFEGRVHEQILPAIRRAGGSVAWTDLYVVHSGSDPSAEAQDRKRRRDLHLLHMELRERPDHPFPLFNVGMTYSDAGQFEEAAEFLRRSIEHSNPDESHLRKAYALLVHAELRRGLREEALETCRRGRELYPQDAELRFREGVVLHELGRLEESAQAYHDVLAEREERHFTSIDRGLSGFKARQNLAVVYSDMGDLAQAEREWRAVTQEVPRYRPGWRGLAEVLTRAGRRDDVMAVTERCLADPALRVEGHLLRGRLALTDGDIATARAEFEQAAAECPTDRAALEARCQILFDHGPPAEAEAALRALIDRHPAEAAAHHNLGMLLSRLKRHEEAAVSLRQALRFRADDPTIYLHLSQTLSDSGRPEEALAAMEQVSRLEPNDAALRARLIRSLSR